MQRKETEKSSREQHSGPPQGVRRSRAAAPRRVGSGSSQVCFGLDQLSWSRLAWLQLGSPVTRRRLGSKSRGAEAAQHEGRGRLDPGSRTRRPRPLLASPPRPFPSRRRVTGDGGWLVPEPWEGRRQTQSPPLPPAPLLLFLLLPLRPGGETQPRASPRATARPRLRDLRGGPARGKGRWPRRPHPRCLHAAPGEALGRRRGLRGVRGVGCSCSHCLPFRRRPGARESASDLEELWERVGEEVPGSGTPGPR